MSEAKSKGLGSAFLDLFSTEVPDKPKVRNTPIPGAPRNTPLPPAPSGDFHSTTGKVDEKALASLEARLRESLPADYAAFMETYQSLAEDIPDERTRFKVALKTSKMDAGHVTAAIDHLLEVMNDAKLKFDKGHEARSVEKLGHARELVQTIQQQISDKQSQVTSLNAEIQALNDQGVTAAREEREERDHLAQVQAGFEAAHAQVIGRLNDQKNRVTSLGTKV